MIIKKLKDYWRNYLKQVNDNGFSLLELVVAVGILLVLTVGGLIAYGSITKNARQAAVQSAASQVFTGAVANDANRIEEPSKVADEWNGTRSKPDITTAAGRTGACIWATAEHIKGEKNARTTNNCSLDESGNYYDNGNGDTGSSDNNGDNGGTITVPGDHDGDGIPDDEQNNGDTDNESPSTDEDKDGDGTKDHQSTISDNGLTEDTIDTQRAIVKGGGEILTRINKHINLDKNTATMEYESVDVDGMPVGTTICVSKLDMVSNVVLDANVEKALADGSCWRTTQEHAQSGKWLTFTTEIKANKPPFNVWTRTTIELPSPDHWGGKTNMSLVSQRNDLDLWTWSVESNWADHTSWDLRYIGQVNTNIDGYPDDLASGKYRVKNLETGDVSEATAFAWDPEYSYDNLEITLSNPWNLGPDNLHGNSDIEIIFTFDDGKSISKVVKYRDMEITQDGFNKNSPDYEYRTMELDIGTIDVKYADAK